MATLQLSHDNEMNICVIAITDSENLPPCRKKDNQKFKPAFDSVAKVVFSSPAFASVGLSEEEAIEQEKDVDVFTSEFT